MQSEDVFKRILVPVDGSLPSMVAQELTVFIAKIFSSQVMVLHVASPDVMLPVIQKPRGGEEVEPVIMTDGQYPRALEIPRPKENAWPEEVVSEISDWYVERGRQIIEEAVARFKDEGISVEQKLVEQGAPADAVITEVERGSYGLIIMGNSGEEERDQHLGSVAKKVAATVEIPVLITRDKIQISRILVPVDGSEKSEKTLRYVDALALKTGAKVTLMYVQESALFSMRPEIASQMGSQILAHAAGRITGVPERKLESGDPAKKIIEVAKKENYDLIAMGSKGHGLVRRFLLGSVSDHVIHYADRSVLLVK